MYSFPIHLCEEVVPAAVFYATVVPLVVYVLVKNGIVEPFQKEQQAIKLEKQKQLNKTKLLEKRKEAQAAIELMSATYARIHDEEVAKKGLVIVRALYGKLLTETTNDYNAATASAEIIDVTIPIQCLVKNSNLVLYEQSKSHMPGFFDPAVGEDKNLLVVYTFRDQTHEVTVRDNEVLRIPHASE